MKGKELKKKDNKRLANCILNVSVIFSEQLVEEEQSREAAKAKHLLQVKAQQAFQEWKQKKSESEREKKCKEEKEIQQRREAKREVVFVFMKLFIDRVFCREQLHYSRSKRIILPVGA